MAGLFFCTKMLLYSEASKNYHVDLDARWNDLDGQVDIQKYSQQHKLAL